MLYVFSLQSYIKAKSLLLWVFTWVLRESGRWGVFLVTFNADIAVGMRAMKKKVEFNVNCCKIFIKWFL